MRLILIIFIFISTIIAQADVKITDSKISFTGSHPFHDWTGNSTELKLGMNCSEENESCNFIFSIPWTSFDSGNDNRDNNMLYFVNAYEFPIIKMSFININLNQISINENSILGELSIMGVKQEQAISLDFNLNDRQFNVSSEFNISLTNFNIERPSLLTIPINNEIIIKVKFSGELLNN